MTNKYVIAFLNMSEGELKQEIVEANSAYDAAMSYLNWWNEDEEDDWEERPKTLSGLELVVFDADCYINVLDLNKALKTNRGDGGLSTVRLRFESESGFQ